MITKPSNQLTIDSFMDAAIGQLNPNNRWVVLSRILPWSRLCPIYESKMNKGKGAPAKAARLAIGALIIKHKLKLSDDETIEQIKENPYLQFFVGLPKFTFDKPFDPSLFPHIRKRLATEDFNEMTLVLQKFEIEINEQGQTEAKSEKSEDKKGDEEEEKKEEKKKTRVLVSDATVAPQEIPYPTDLKLAASARVKSEQIIDQLWKHITDKSAGKPRTYRDTADREFVKASKKRKKSKEYWLKATDQQLRYLERNIRHIDQLLDEIKGPIPLNSKFLKLMYVIREVARQQRGKLNSGGNVIENRIVNIFQPHVRPIKRGKDNAETEFGAKFSLSIEDGYTYVDKASWNNYYEGKDEIVEESINSFNKRSPENKLTRFVGDKLFGNKGAREIMKKHGVEFIGTPLGRPPKDPDKIKQREKNQKIHQRLRSQVEGKIGQAKRGYGLDKIKARQPDTSLPWAACILFITNLERFWKGIFFDLIFGEFLCNIWEAFMRMISHKSNLSVARTS